MEISESQPRRPQLPSITTATSGGPTYEAPTSSSRQHISAPSVAFLTSATDSRKGGFEDSRSLPSISEALGPASSLAPASATSSQFSYPQRSPSSPRFTWQAANADPNSAVHTRRISQDHTGRAPFIGHIEPATPPTSQSSVLTRSYTPRSSVYDSRTNEPQQQPYIKAQSPRPSSPRSAWAVPPPPSQYESYSRGSEPASRQYPYAPYPPPPPPHSYPQPPPANTYDVPPQYAAQTPAWRSQQPPDAQSIESVRKSGDNYGESVKRHLDVFDLESALNEVCYLGPFPSGPYAKYYRWHLVVINFLNSPNITAKKHIRHKTLVHYLDQHLTLWRLMK